MKINLCFLISDGKNIILSNHQDLPPTIQCDKKIGETSTEFLKDVFSINEEWGTQLRFLGYLEKDDHLFLCHGILVPESFNLPPEFYWESVRSLENVIEDQKFYFTIMSFLNSI